MGDFLKSIPVFPKFSINETNQENHHYHKTMKNSLLQIAHQGGKKTNGSLFGRRHAVNGVSKTKDGARLVSINNPKEATHTDIAKLSKDIGPLLPAELGVPPQDSPSILCLHQHLA